MNTVTLVVVKDSDIGNPNMTPYNMCHAVISVTGPSKQQGV